jgi:hypothetical protein
MAALAHPCRSAADLAISAAARAMAAESAAFVAPAKSPADRLPRPVGGRPVAIATGAVIAHLICNEPQPGLAGSLARVRRSGRRAGRGFAVVAILECRAAPPAGGGR